VPGAGVPATLTAFELVNKVRSTGSFLDKKYARQNTVLTDEKLDETEARSEHSPRKSLTRLVQQTQVSTTTVRTATTKLRLFPHKNQAGSSD
jgi:hypothetical protein